MTMFGLFGKKEEPRPRQGVWLSAEKCKQHFEDIGRAGRSESESARRYGRHYVLLDGAMERFVAFEGKIVDVGPFAQPAPASGAK
ncbi:hypothetical protein [Rhizobium sp. BK176]|uniref:hypothetical protein n=1 Tax=Rhizobium sp. BK176 TaxID=2587071 RepID=UPI002169FBA2|nr:hypothetical protein [Rhizobium sp. BK176]MCS4089510.1 hypothetical protein [Rhizobium sp. BK176]